MSEIRDEEEKLEKEIDKENKKDLGKLKEVWRERN